MSEETSRKALYITLYGQVQGVGFRFFTQKTASRLGVVGWVKNMSDGTVEIWAEGRETTLKEFKRAVREGPSHAYVRKMDTQWLEPKEDYSSFHIRY